MAFFQGLFFGLGLGTPNTELVHISYYFRLMDNLTQKDPVWRENGKAFVESVTRLLERLLDYRNVGQVRYEISDSKSKKYVVFITLGRKSTFYPKIHILKKSQFLQNSAF